MILVRIVPFDVRVFGRMGCIDPSPSSEYRVKKKSNDVTIRRSPRIRIVVCAASIGSSKNPSELFRLTGSAVRDGQGDARSSGSAVYIPLPCVPL